mmetsp:Transcript_34832/g.109365  ORF Transcript_34832/g.109365 Transcript_34832/m.109365 type:complete len:207 (+) Transcript_34832:280-900(+)
MWQVGAKTSKPTREMGMTAESTSWPRASIDRGATRCTLVAAIHVLRCRRHVQRSGRRIVDRPPRRARGTGNVTAGLAERERAAEQARMQRNWIQQPARLPREDVAASFEEEVLAAGARLGAARVLFSLTAEVKVLGVGPRHHLLILDGAVGVEDAARGRVVERVANGVFAARGVAVEPVRALDVVQLRVVLNEELRDHVVVALPRR